VTLTGKLDKDVPANSNDELVVPFLDASFVLPIGDVFSIDLCTAMGIKCPILKGNEINTSVSVLVPDAKDLPEGYGIEVAVIEDGGLGDIIEKG
ncbi:11110_t:CDS:2, partial [Scutellospora calospora]